MYTFEKKILNYYQSVWRKKTIPRQNYYKGNEIAYTITSFIEKENPICIFIYIFCCYNRTEYWEGGILPKIGQFGATLISLYNPEVLNSVVFALNMTHAHLRVDEVQRNQGLPKKGRLHIV